MNESEIKSSPRLDRLKQLLDDAKMAYVILAHDQNMASADDGVIHGLGDLASMAPTFILQSEAGFLAAIVRGDTRLVYKKIKQRLGLKNVSLAAPEQVEALTGSQVGHVALINPGIKTIVDQRLLEKSLIYGGSGELNHTLQIDPQAVVSLNQAEVFDFTILKN